MEGFVIEPNQIRVGEVLNVTATDTSNPIDIGGAKKVSLMLERADHSSGQTVWTVEISLDGTTWEATNMLISNATNTNAQGYTRVASLTQSADGVDLVLLDVLHLAARYMRVTATETTDGTHKATVAVVT